MKLRSIALAGLLGAGMLMTSGCTEDDVKDAINDIAKPNAIYVVNGFQTGDITAFVGSESDVVAAAEMAVYPTAGEDTTSVYYERNGGQSGAEDFAYGNAHMFLAAECDSTPSSLEFLTDSSTGEGTVEVFNVSGADHDISTDAEKVFVIVDNNGVVDTIELTPPASSVVQNCHSVTASQKLGDLGIVQGSKVQIKVGTTGTPYPSTPYTVEDNVPTDVDIDIVVISSEQAVFVPLIKWDDLLSTN